MSLYLFGFGSLMHPRSLGRALGRQIRPDELRHALIHGLRRDWGLRELVYSHDVGREVNAAFLDVTPHEEACVNGVMVAVSRREYEGVRLREKNYAELDVTRQLIGQRLKPGDTLLTSAGMPEHRKNDPDLEVFLLRRYLNMIEEALFMLGPEATKIYGRTTVEPSLSILGGRYTFIDPQQASRV